MHSFYCICRLLKDKNRDGTYLIRGGSHAGAEKVLSVWHIDRCRHYKLFKDDVSGLAVPLSECLAWLVHCVMVLWHFVSMSSKNRANVSMCVQGQTKVSIIRRFMY
jgi:hypothetical protein